MPPAEAQAVTAAIEAAVLERLGAVIEIAVDDLHVGARLDDARGLVAVLDPATRLGTPARVPLRILRGRGRAVRIGEARCIIRVRAAHYQVTAPIARGDTVSGEAVRLADGWLDGLSLQPVARDVLRARALRDLTPGDIVLGHDVAVPPAIRSGDTVSVHVTTAGIRVTAEAVAAQDGHPGEEIRVVNPSSGRVLRGRVVGPGQVEVHHGS